MNTIRPEYIEAVAARWNVWLIPLFLAGISFTLFYTAAWIGVSMAIRAITKGFFRRE